MLHPVGLQRASGGRKLGTGTRRGIRLAASKLAGVGRAAVTGFEPDGARTAGCFCVGAGFSCMAEELAAGSLPPGCRSRANLITWARVGKSRSLRFSSRGMLYAARTAANISACLTVSTPRSASRSRSEIQHVFRIAGLLGHDLQHFLLDGIVGGRLGRNGRRREHGWLADSR